MFKCSWFWWDIKCEGNAIIDCCGLAHVFVNDITSARWQNPYPRYLGSIFLYSGRKWRRTIHLYTGSVRSKHACLEWAVHLACGDAVCSFLYETVKVTCSYWTAANKDLIVYKLTARPPFPSMRTILSEVNLWLLTFSSKSNILLPSISSSEIPSSW